MPPQQSHCDHGVSGQVHWLLDEKLVGPPRAHVARAPRPALLRHAEALEPPPGRPIETPVPAPRRTFLLFLGGLVTALVVLALLRTAAVGGALEDVFSGRDNAPVRVTAGFEEPGGRETAELRLLLGTVAPPSSPPGSRTGPDAPDKPGKPKDTNPPVGVLPPPPPAPPPVIPELPLPKVPGVEVPPLPRLEAPELPGLPELPELP